MIWPNNHAFAFTVFDDPDSQTLETSREVYSFLSDLGFRTTIGVWPLAPRREASDHGETCGNPAYRTWMQELQQRGFEMGFHNATSHTSTREETAEGLTAFENYFGQNPSAMANHYYSKEAIYFGDARLTGIHRPIYNALTRFQNKNWSRGHVPGDPLFWGDYCHDRIRYVRNFAFRNLNTLQECPFMPYYDPLRPYVNEWYNASEGANVVSMLDRIQEHNLDSLAEQRGASIMYTHFGHGYMADGKLSPRFKELATRISKMNGWLVPVSTLLDYLKSQQGPKVITDVQRTAMERKWLWHKVRFGTA